MNKEKSPKQVEQKDEKKLSKYFFPSYGMTVEAETREAAEELAKKLFTQSQ